MKKMAQLLVICLVSLLFLSSAMAEEQEFIFLNGLPEGAPNFLTNQEAKGSTKKLVIPIEIPGLAKIDKMELLYVEYSGKLPSNWSGTTMMWHKKGLYWPIYAHIAIKKGSDLSVVYQQVYHVGFLAALCISGIDLPKIKNDTHDTAIYFAGAQWSLTQLENAVSYIGLIQGARAAKKPEIIEKAFKKISEMPNKDYSDRSGLTRAFIGISEKNPDEYIRKLGMFIEGFVKITPKINTETRDYAPKKAKLMAQR